ncbi:M48 family metallopeptidase [Amphritea balenae]|uniref:M48 family peptidase n=1 Tax=Amphritea balenae TaxID=452629 RepID=A0A3P1STT9_9GAMM|nr:SprT family zinc-dependent metalloprotease [Amphritea balenae]RRD00500.1 M48 family peptidase [Amphritea balenae]GGK70236.1 hypothetical protein GCM10007941_20580 [Amphritea balenae]
MVYVINTGFQAKDSSIFNHQQLPEYSLRRSKRRKTVEIQVRPDQVRVLAPFGIAQSHIDRFVKDKTAWIQQRQQALQAQQSRQPQPVTLNTGCWINVLGQQVRLQVTEDRPAAGVELQQNILQLWLSARIKKPRTQAISDQLEKWYRQQAEQLFQQRVMIRADQMGLQPSRIIIRSYRRRWGSCNSRREVSFNWLLVMAPEFIVDYVIVHELCHLREMNHSSAFWQLVQQYCPEYRLAKAWLNKNGSLMQWPPVQSGKQGNL